jgi:lipid II:glycine glycyltransferase (peptidoglycan interpeptide bridge formation enzyme)
MNAIDASHSKVMCEKLMKDWNEILASFPGAHVLQTSEWGQVKSQFGWKSDQEVWRDSLGEAFACAQVLTRDIAIRGVKLPLRVLYVPRGPILRSWQDAGARRDILASLKKLVKQEKAIFIKIDPEVEWGRGEDEQEKNPSTEAIVKDLIGEGWIKSPEQVQFRNTMVVNLIPEPEQLLADMKQKTRYNIRLASRRGVVVRQGSLSDLELLYELYAETSIRDGFAIRSKEYYRTVWKTFIENGLADPLIAEVDGEPVAGIVVFRFADRAWYMYGMSKAAHREKMPNYLLQWEGMLRAREAGCTSYDLWGAPEKFNEEDRLWGVYRFKQGLGAEVIRYIGAWDLPLNKSLYRFYTQLMPRILNRLRRRGMAETRGSIQAG